MAELDRSTTMTPKRFFLAGVALLVLVIVGLLFATPGAPRYRAASTVVFVTTTNLLSSRTFETYIAQRIPGVLRLEASPASKSTPGSAPPAAPNAVAVRIVVTGVTAEDTQRFANDAAAQLCRLVWTNYGLAGDLAVRADSARRYSFFHASFEPFFHASFPPGVFKR